MSAEDITYYRRRVVAEQARAAEAPTPEIAAVHAKLANLYGSLTERLERSQAEQDDEAPLPTGERHSH